MGEHPHDCPPECFECEREGALERLCDELECDAPVFLGSRWLGWSACGSCERCRVVA